MSLSEQTLSEQTLSEQASPGQPSRRKALLGLMALSGMLGGCGFRPLYQGGRTGGAGALLGSVGIDIGGGELNFRLRDALIRALTPSGENAPLRLTVNTTVTRRGLAIEEDDEITRYNMDIASTYSLMKSGSDDPLTKGTVRSIAAFNATSSQYATIVSEREVLDRAARDVADKIVNRLAAAFEPGWLE